MNVDVRVRLRFIRMRKRMSQREVARRAGMTNATISLIELSRMSPSGGAFKRFLDGIPITLSEFSRCRRAWSTKHSGAVTYCSGSERPDSVPSGRVTFA